MVLASSTSSRPPEVDGIGARPLCSAPASPVDSAASHSAGRSSPTTSQSDREDEPRGRPPTVDPHEARPTLGARAEGCELERPIRADETGGSCDQQQPVAASDAGLSDQRPPVDASAPQNRPPPVELRLLVRRREAGALIGKRGSNIKRLRDSFRSSMFSIPDTGNGPERIVCIVTGADSLDAILTDLSQLFVEKSPENDEQIELKLLIHSSHAGSLIGLGGQSIKRLRNDSKAAIKIYEMCCPLSNERVCAIKAKPPVVVNAIELILSILGENPIKGTVKPYDALHFDLNLVDKYGGYLPDEAPQCSIELMANQGHFEQFAFGRQMHESGGYLMKPYSVWRAPDYKSNRRPSSRQESADDMQAVVEPSAKRSGHSTQASDDVSSPDAQTTTSRSSPKQNAARRAPDASSSDHEQMNYMKAQHSARQQAVRYHPYATMANGQVAFLAQAAAVDRQLVATRHLPLGASGGGTGSGPPMIYPRGMHFAGHPAAAIQRHRGAQYISVPAAGLYPAPGAHCRHDRPCLCMFLPMVPEVVPTGPYVQLGKSFACTRGSAYGFKK